MNKIIARSKTISKSEKNILTHFIGSDIVLEPRPAAHIVLIINNAKQNKFLILPVVRSYNISLTCFKETNESDLVECFFKIFTIIIERHQIVFLLFTFLFKDVCHLSSVCCTTNECNGNDYQLRREA